MASVTEIIVCSILLAAISLVIVPVLSYYVITYYKHRTSPMIYKRHYKLIIVFNSFLIVSLIGDKCLFLVSIILAESMHDAQQHLAFQISDYVSFCIGPLIILIACSSVWMLYYDITWLNITNPGNKWTHFINPHFNQNHSRLLSNNWFIRHQGTFGNTQWLTKWITFPSCIVIWILLFSALFIHSSVRYILFSGWMTAMTALIAFLWCKIPKHQIEVFKIRSQWEQFIKLGTAFVFCFALYIIVKGIVTDSKYQFLITLPFQYLFTFLYFVGGLISTRYVLMESDIGCHSSSNHLKSNHHSKSPSYHQRIKSMTSKLQHSLTFGSNIFVDPDADPVASRPTTPNHKPTHLSLKKILANNLWFHSFMSHLLKEFSSENLLAIIECMQFKEAIKKIHDPDPEELKNASNFNSNHRKHRSGLMSPSTPSAISRIFGAISPFGMNPITPPTTEEVTAAMVIDVESTVTVTSQPTLMPPSSVTPESEGDDEVDGRSNGMETDDVEPNGDGNVFRICIERVDTERTEADGEDTNNETVVVEEEEEEEENGDEQIQLTLNKGLIGYSLPKYPDIPRSQIVYGNNGGNGDDHNEDNTINTNSNSVNTTISGTEKESIDNIDPTTMEKRAMQLIEKYVYTETGNCIFEVNLSSNCKMTLIEKRQLLADEGHTCSPMDLYVLFDQMLMELLHLLSDSHIRFIQTDDYKQLFVHNAL